jgi:pyruvate/2-oxoglutarate/acetoin dehydrogenase E1 component
VSNSDNARRPRGTFAGEINAAFEVALELDQNVVIGGQMPRYGVAGLTTGLYEKYPQQFITYSVSESLMNSSAMGLALAGKRVVMLHVRMDFLACGMDALVNHIPVWAKKGTKLPIVIFCQIGRGGGQGPQHSKDLTSWFARMDGWTVAKPETPQQAHDMMLASIFGDKPVMYVVHRIMFNETGPRGDPHAGACRYLRHQQAPRGRVLWRLTARTGT